MEREKRMESFDVHCTDGSVMRVTISRDDLADMMLRRLCRKRYTKCGHVSPWRVTAIQGSVRAEWVLK